jgi:hypothetical protein
MLAYVFLPENAVVQKEMLHRYITAYNLTYGGAEV